MSITPRASRNTVDFTNKHFIGSSENCVFHLMLNPPLTGCGIEVTFLQKLKRQHFKIIMTAIEFAMYEEREKHKIFEYIPHADEIIFLDEMDQFSALDFASTHNQSLIPKIRASHVIPVPPTIDSTHISTEKTRNNIMSFGMIRSGKGFDHTLRLAELLKQNHSTQKIYIVGSVQKASIRTDDNVYDPTLYELLCKLYPAHIDRFVDKSPEELKPILSNIQLTESPELPVEIYLDIPESELKQLFQECKYAFYAAHRGATLRNSSISNCLAFGCIIYSHVGDITPSCLRTGGKYAHAMILSESCEESDYAKFVFEDMAQREENPVLNTKTLAAASELTHHELSLKTLVQKHVDIYAAHEQCKMRLVNS
jgi:hypothetical protein